MIADLKFVDLFAGLGGFNHGLSKAGGFECVFASEIDQRLRDLYEVNHGHTAEGDITKVDVGAVPEHDVLCAGFPCQPFSLAGLKRGTGCPKSGKLIDHVVRIAKHRMPEILILENVPGLMTVANGSVWEELNTAFNKLGYELIHKVISPLDLGIPQNRKRLFVVASLNYDLSNVFDWPTPEISMRLEDFLSNDPNSQKPVEPKKRFQLEKWQQLLTNCTLPKEMPILSISAQEFGATYPIDFSKRGLNDLKKYRGAYGKRLEGCRNWKEMLDSMPSYCRKSRRVPDWLKSSVEFSRDIYQTNKGKLDEWHADFDKRYNSWQLLEWRGDRNKLLLSEHLLQFRASGIRVAKPCTIPSLVAMTTTQVPIIGSEMRYLSKCEAARFQNLHELSVIPDTDTVAFKAIGNAVNAKIVERIASNLKRILSTRLNLGVCNAYR